MSNKILEKKQNSGVWMTGATVVTESPVPAWARDFRKCSFPDGHRKLRTKIEN